jgi:hypothetical protein
VSSILSGAIDCDVYCVASDYPHDHGSDALDNLLGVLTEDDREAVLTKNAAAFFDIQVPAVS